MISANKKLLMASGTPIDRTYDVTNADFTALSLVNYDYPAITKSAITSSCLVPLDGGSRLIMSLGLTLLELSTTTSYGYHTATLDENSNRAVSVGNSYVRSDGVMAYVAGDTTNTVYQYTMATPWNFKTIGTATSRSMAGLGTTPLSHLYFKGDGTKLYLLYQGSRTVVELTLSTAWDITTATATGVVLDMTADIPTGRTLRNIQFKTDGSSVFVVSYASNVIYVTEYALSTPWDLSSTSFVQTTSRSASGQETLSFNPSGTEAYTITYFAGTVYKYALSTAWDLSTSTLSGSFSVTSGQLNYNALFIPDTGTHFVISRSLFVDRVVIAAPASGTPFDYSTLSSLFNPSLTCEGTGSVGWFRFGNSGTKLFVMDTTRELYEYTLSTAYDIASASYTGNSITLPAATLTYGTAFDVSGDGTKIVCSASGAQVNQYTLATAWDLSTASGPTLVSLADVPPSPVPTCRPVFASDGSKAFIFNRSEVYTYPLSTSWDMTTAGTPVVSVHPMRMAPNVTLIDGGTKLALGSTSNFLAFNIPVANSVATAPYNNHIFQPDESTGTAFFWRKQLCFNVDGTRMYTQEGNTIYQWNLGTPYDFNTASLVDQYNTGIFGVFFHATPDERYFLRTTSANVVYQYEASTPGDLTTLSLVGTKTGISGLRAVTYSNDGSYLYAVTGSLNFFAYPLSTSFDITTAGTGVSTGSAGSLTEGGVLSPSGAAKDTFTMISYANSQVITRYATGSGLYLNAKPIKQIMAEASDAGGYNQNAALNGVAWASSDGTKVVFSFYGTFSADVRETLVTFDIPT